MASRRPSDAVLADWLRQRERMFEAANSAVDAKMLGVEKALAKDITRLQRLLMTELGSVKRLATGLAFDPTDPDNAALLSRIRNELAAHAQTLAGALSVQMGDAYAVFLREAAGALVSEMRPEILAMQQLAEVSGQMARVTEAEAQAVFRAFQQAVLLGDVSEAQLRDQIMDLVPRTKAQAETILRGHLMSSYRQVSLADGQLAGVNAYIYDGPMDDRIRQFCFEQLGKTRTREEWVEIKADIFLYGGGYGCRHTLAAVPETIRERMEEQYGAGDRAVMNRSAREQIREIEEDYDGSVPDWIAAKMEKEAA